MTTNTLIRTVPLGRNGSTEVVTIGRFVAKRYSGKFGTSALNSRVCTGLWYSYAMGVPQYHCLNGEGNSPEASVADLKARASELVQAITTAFDL